MAGGCIPTYDYLDHTGRLYTKPGYKIYSYMIIVTVYGRSFKVDWNRNDLLLLVLNSVCCTK